MTRKDDGQGLFESARSHPRYRSTLFIHRWSVSRSRLAQSKHRNEQDSRPCHLTCNSTCNSGVNRHGISASVTGRGGRATSRPPLSAFVCDRSTSRTLFSRLLKRSITRAIRWLFRGDPESSHADPCSENLLNLLSHAKTSPGAPRVLTRKINLR